MFKARVEVTLKDKILDPQGKAIESSLHNLAFSTLSGVRTGKEIELSIHEKDLDTAKAVLHSACARLLANPVTEEYELEIFEEDGTLVASYSSRKEVSLPAEKVAG